MNSHLRKLYSELSFLYRDIGSVCIGCQDHDCEGYVWLLKEEASALYELNVPIVEINESTFFIHSFKEANGSLLIDKPKPPCSLRQKGFCSIYKSRPLVCRMYPIGFVVMNDEIAIALHKDCQFSRNLNTRNAKKTFYSQILQILRQAPNNLLQEIGNTYAMVNKISSFPNGPNDLEVIISLGSILGKRRWGPYVKMQGRS